MAEKEIKDELKKECGCKSSNNEEEKEIKSCDCEDENCDCEDENCDCKEEQSAHDHEHEHTHDHDHDHEELEMDDFDVITLTLEDDSELQCAVLSVFDLDDQDYIALLPLSEDEVLEEKEVLLYRFKELDNEEIEINMIESEEEFERVSKRYYEVAEELDEEYDAEIDDFEEDEDIIDE